MATSKVADAVAVDLERSYALDGVGGFVEQNACASTGDARGILAHYLLIERAAEYQHAGVLVGVLLEPSPVEESAGV